jgi:hypothetical protein
VNKGAVTYVFWNYHVMKGLWYFKSLGFCFSYFYLSVFNFLFTSN